MEDEHAGQNDEAAGEQHHDPAQVQEGSDEIQAGQIEVNRGRDEEREYLMNHEFHKVIEVTGLDAQHFDEVKFQSALAEVLGVPLFDVTVGAIDLGTRRRLLAADSLSVPVTLKCDGREDCKRQLGQLEGIICNGALARALSEIFGLTIRTPGCKAYKTPLSPFDPENAHSVTFPDAYPNSVRHWLLIGALSMMLGAVLVFVFTFVPSRTPPMASVLVFIACAVSMCAYYAMWAGIWVDFKTSDVTPRVIFYPKYFDWIVTVPLTLAAICLVAEAEAALLVSLAGNGVLMVLCQLVGSSVVAPYKFVWWMLGVVFLVIIFVILGRVMRQRNGRGVRNLVVLICATWFVYPIVWVTGSEGTAALGLTQEVAVTCLLDIVSKVGFALLVVTSPSATGKEQEGSYAYEDQRVQAASFAPLL